MASAGSSPTARRKGSKLEEHFLLQIQGRRLPPPVREYRFHATRRWRLDLAWPGFVHPVAVELDGGIYFQGRHTRGAGYEADCEKLNAAAEAGWCVLRGGPAMVRSCLLIDTLERVLRGRAVRQDHPRPARGVPAAP